MPRILLPWLCLVLLLGARVAAGNVTPPVTLLPAAELREDARLLRRIVETLHPGLLRYNTPAGIDSAFRNLDAEFAVDRTAGEAFVAFSRLTHRFRCGHTFPSPYNQSDDFQAAWLNGPRIPFTFRWIGNRMIVTRSLSAASPLSPGTEVLSIDGVAAATLLERLMTVGRADGSNDAKRRNGLAVGATSEYEAFDIYFRLLCGWAGGPLELIVRGPGDGASRRVTVPPLTFEERQAVVRASSPATTGGSPLWSCERLPDGVALLRMPTWVTYNSSWPWAAWLDSTFTELAARPPRGVVIDLRGNEGGTTEVGTRLAAFLIDQPLELEAVERRVRYRAVPADLVPYLDTWDPSFRNWGDAAVPLPDGGYALNPGGAAATPVVLAPRTPRVAAPVVVLVDAANSSATFQFASIVQRHALATLVGEPTGGNQRGINGGALFFVRLPRSGVEIDLPLIGYFPPGELPDAGLTPDVLVAPTPLDIAAGRDPALERARRLILESAGPGVR